MTRSALYVDHPHELVEIACSDGYVARGRLVRAAAQPSVRGAVVYLHGIQSHGGWYLGSAAALARRGRLVLLPDRRGSGLNEAERGHTPSARQLVDDVITALRDASSLVPAATPIDVIAVSWGAKLAAATAAACLRRHGPTMPLPRSLTFVAPGFCAQVDAPLAQRLRIGLALASGRTRRPFALPLGEPALFTDEPAGQEFLKNDPLTLRLATARLMWTSRVFDRLARQARPLLRLPVHVILAERDRITANRPTRSWLANVPGPVHIDELPASHTLEFEPDPQPFFSCLVDWLDGLGDHNPYLG